jgi:molybdate transport repressor ModE-like protein
MDVSLEVRWRVDGRPLDERALPLLRAIARRGSLNQAVREVGLSYRHAWGMLGQLQNLLGAPPVALARGRGAQLTALGKKLVVADDALEAKLAPILRGMSTSIGRSLATTRALENDRVVMQASHDIALGKLRDFVASSRLFDFELHFQGSLDCLAALARGQCDFAGFHVPEPAAPSTLISQFRPWLKTKTLRLIHFATRRQGLMVARGNPLGVKTLADLARTRARFVNRQPGSGTRLVFDHLLATHKIRPARINGYSLEEFTHAAVAATIASGMADAGVGIEAAARQHRLDFVPLATERYYLAARASTLNRPGPSALLAALESSEFRRILRGLPGYTAPPNLKIASVQQIFH